MKQRILVTGFQPFLHHSMNVSEMLLQELGRERTDIEVLLLPVSFQKSFLEFKRHWDLHGPYRSVVMLGQAKGREGVSLERVALNWMESKNPDNDGECPPSGRIFADAPDSYLVDFFPSAWKDSLMSLGKTEISLTAGAYVCNNLYFKVTHSLRAADVAALFVHLPLLPEQLAENPGSPTLEFTTQKRVVAGILDLMKGL